MTPRARHALLLPLLLAACATDILPERERAMMSGRYAEMERLAEAQVPNPASAKTTKLAPLCMAYSKLKRYDKLGPCLDQLEKNVAAGDTNFSDMEAMEKKSPFMAGMAKMGAAMSGVSLEQDVSPYLWELRVETYLELGDYARAVEYAKKMYAAIPKQWNLERAQRIHAVGELALALTYAGDTAQAEERAKELEGISTAYPYVLLKTDKQVYLARIYLALKHYAKAYDILQEDDNSAFRALADVVSGGATLEGGSLFAFQQLQRRFMRHKSELETGRLKEARIGYDALLQNPATRENGDFFWIVLYDRGRIAERENKAAEAIDFLRQAVDVIERQRSTLNTEAAKIGFIGSKQTVYQDLIRLLVKQGRSAEAFDYVERSKARALVDMLAGKKDFAVASGNAQDVLALLAASSKAENETRLTDGETASQSRSLVARQRAQLAAQAPELASLVTVSSGSTAAIQARLAATETLVEYYYGSDDALYAFVLTRDSLRVVPLDGANLAGEIQAFRQAINSPRNDSWKAPAQRLYARLMQPLEGMIGAAPLTIVAHGALHYLPFNALHDGKQFLIERRELRALPAASVLQFLKPAGGDKPGSLLAFGNPDLGNPQYDLPFAQSEASTIAAATPGAKVLLRKEASKAAFKRYAGGFRYVHIASHGEFDPEAPLESALLLAADGGSDGRLTVSELYSMRLDADLVTLSACETGLGKIASGDDVVGLTRGFLYAGASHIVSSLWQVDDRATGDLMTAFYEGLRGGAEKRAALRQAQLRALQRYSHPFYWAAFQITGG